MEGGGAGSGDLCFACKIKSTNYASCMQSSWQEVGSKYQRLALLEYSHSNRKRRQPHNQAICAGFLAMRGARCRGWSGYASSVRPQSLAWRPSASGNPPFPLPA